MARGFFLRCTDEPPSGDLSCGLLQVKQSLMVQTERVMSFGEHLNELRTRLVHGLIGLVVLFIIALVFGGPILEFLCAPLLTELKANGQAPVLLATSPLEAFGSYIKVATVAALLTGMPWILLQLWFFISPGLYPKEQRFVYFLLPMSVVLTLTGVTVLYYVILPISLYFLINFGSGLIDPAIATATIPEGMILPTIPVLSGDPVGVPSGSMWVNEALGSIRIQVDPERIMGLPLVSGGMIAQQYRISEYVNLLFLLGLAFAIAFQVPLVLLLLGWAGFLQPQDLTRYRKQVIFGCVIGAALLPTQDPWSLIILSCMLYGLFEFGILLMRLVPARRVAAGLITAPTRSSDADEEA